MKVLLLPSIMFFALVALSLGVIGVVGNWKPFDVLIWGESAAKNGLTGMTYKAGINHAGSGDKYYLKKDRGKPILMGGAETSVTKPRGGAVVPDNSRGGLPIYYNGGLDLARVWNESINRQAPTDLDKGDYVTGQGDSTNVNEVSMLGVELVYGSPARPWSLFKVQNQYEDVIQDILTITSAAAITHYSGEAVLKDALTNYKLWSDPEANFEVLGIIPNISDANGGFLQFRNLAGEWQGHNPAIPTPKLSTITFDPHSASKPLQPIPVDPETATAGMFAEAAGAHVCILVLGKVKAGGGEPKGRKVT